MADADHREVTASPSPTRPGGPEQPDLLGGLGADQQRAVRRVMVRRTFRKGDSVFHAGDPGDSLHVIVQGLASVRVPTARGDTATLTVLGPGAFFGEQALLSSSARRTASIVAVKALETLMLHRRDFERLRADDPRLDRLLVEVLAAQVRRLSDLVTEALYEPADRRLVARLTDLVGLLAGGRAEPVVIPLTQDDLATMAGTTRPTVNRLLQALEARNLVELGRGRLTVPRPAEFADATR